MDTGTRELRSSGAVRISWEDPERVKDPGSEVKVYRQGRTVIRGGTVV